MPAERPHPDAVTFRTKVDLWLIAVLVVALGGGLVAGAAAADLGTPGSWVPLVTLLCTVLLIVLAAVPTEYTLSETDLLIRFGRFHRAIPLSAIRRVYPSHNPLSSPAWSLDRIAVHYRDGGRRGYALISPVQREEFLKLLGQRAGLKESPRGLVPIEPRD